jgi:MFS family permease
MSNGPVAAGRMSPVELRASLSLASLFALRMLGLFLILPVFAVHALQLEGGESAFLVGIALGAYGGTQGILQIPYGAASDRWGRKRVIVVGLLVFALGSFVAAWASDIYTVILGRALQGAGAISAPVTAFAADLTREEHRTKAMAMIGGSIGLMFALSLVAAPALYPVIGMKGLFELTGFLSLAAIWVTLSVVPSEPQTHDTTRRVEGSALRAVLRNADQLRLNFGIFTLHVVQMAIFVVVPVAMVRHGGLPVSEHWKVYLPVVLGSFALMAPALMWAERHGRTKLLFLGSVGLLAAVELGLAAGYTNLLATAALLLAFFVAFNILEASLPAIVSRVAPAASRGTALGVYNTTQALGLFVGSAAGGWLAAHLGEPAVFVFGTALVALWLGVAAGMRVPGDTARRTYRLVRPGDALALRERLVRVRGVRDVEVAPGEGAVRLTVYPDIFEERDVRQLIEGDESWHR